ncbi:PAS domain-containing protein [Tenacibaculum sp. 1_MG-2023]|uniref:PAS domain-containing protein n=1 Tax=Tenacibaculum sp. 1_MG-2023 TaxID=3062653 RepID=UPI0026E2C242|nr:PAS domain-containing protein [Tenacibaculum sp. 1_MG-2023]MDO6676816.1 PAS domain-containing protein [Tenacibaculum sp. 1_MG-2023]
MTTNNYQKKWDSQTRENQKRKPKLPKPVPIDTEIKLNDNAILLSITDTRGVIEYCNEDFVNSCGYEVHELAGSGHNIVRHPDMPKIIFKLMWQRLKEKRNMVAFVKNLAKSGRYYWVMTDFIVKENEKGEVTHYKGIRKAAPKKAINEITPLYKKLLEIEGLKDVEASEKFLTGFLDAKNTDYDTYVEYLISDYNDLNMFIKDNTKKGSFFKRFFGVS